MCGDGTEAGGGAGADGAAAARGELGSGATLAYLSRSSITLVASTHALRSVTKRCMYGWFSWLSNAARSR